MNIKSTQENK